MAVELGAASADHCTHLLDADVDALAGNKLSVFQEGQPVTLELDADNVMVDIYRGR